MEKIDINVRLRPIRFGFLVRPTDGRSLRNIFEVNTCLWGGLFNPIIPFLSKVPPWWERHGIRFDSAKQIMNGYLDFFEPDFLVEAEPGMAETLGYDASRVVALADLLRRRGDRNHRGVGLDVLDLYHKLYREEFQFVRRHPTIALDVRAAPAFRTFAACVFGAFPEEQAFTQFRKTFEAIFEPERIDLDEASFARLHQSAPEHTSRVTPLRLGVAELEVDFNRMREPMIFVLDATKPSDLIDFWNLRAFERDVIVVPVQWLGAMSAFCKRVIRDGHHPLEGNPNGVTTHITTMFSRSIPDDQIEPLFVAHMQVDQPGANVLQSWYPPIWRPTPGIMMRQTRPMISAESTTVSASVGDSLKVRFQGLHPEFADRFGSEHRWANVVGIDQWGTKDRIASVFPTDVRKNVGLGHLGSDEPPVSTTEGLVAFPQFKNIDLFWQLRSGADAITRWLQREGIKATPSDAGRATQEIIHTLEGFWGVAALANKGVVNVLDGMARTHTRSSHQRKFQNEIESATGTGLWSRGAFKTLVKRKVVELGHELKCTNCGSWSWRPLSELGETVTCDLCLQPFAFPIEDPSNSKMARWAYRVIGPFALPGYANGGYAAALSIRFFNTLHALKDPRVTWASGQDLVFADGTKSEVDFIAWYQRKEIGRVDYPTDIIFGEAKSFGRPNKERIEDKDIDRLKALAVKFPGSICVLATLREGDELLPVERERIRRFAEWGREYNRDLHRPRASVLLLTGTELFAPHSFDFAWKEAGGRLAQLVEPGWMQTENLVTLADLTQQFYLDMPSYDTWAQERRKRMDERRKGRAARGNADAADHP